MAEVGVVLDAPQPTLQLTDYTFPALPRMPALPPTLARYCTLAPPVAHIKRSKGSGSGWLLLHSLRLSIHAGMTGSDEDRLIRMSKMYCAASSKDIGVPGLFCAVSFGPNW